MKSTSNSISSSELNATEKHDEVSRLISVLELDLREKNLLPPQRNATLEELRRYTRSVDGADPLFTKQAILVLCRHSFDGNSLTTGREALKCLANIMLLEESTRQIFVDLGYAPKAAECLKHDNRDDEFLATRLLFLCTYNTNLNFEELFTNNGLPESLNTNISRHAKYFSKSGSKEPSQINILALSETLKLFFNLTQFYPDHTGTFTKSLLPILKAFANTKLPSPPLQPPVTYLINSLLNLDLEDSKARYFATNPLFPKFDAKCNVNRLVGILDSALRSYKDEQLEQLASPLTALIRKIFSFAPDNVKAHMRAQLLPSDEERVHVLGKSDSLSAHLLRLSTSPVAPALRESIQNLLFELSDKDATSFVRNVGYGFASGFLMTHDMPIPENALEAWSNGGSIESLDGDEDSSSEEGTPSAKCEAKPGRSDFAINPITGQRRDMEKNVDEMPPMSEEEKLREAERLFVLFERLRATGVVNVENPVTKSLREGRFEELN